MVPGPPKRTRGPRSKDAAKDTKRDETDEERKEETIDMIRDFIGKDPRGKSSKVAESKPTKTKRRTNSSPGKMDQIIAEVVAKNFSNEDIGESGGNRGKEPMPRIGDVEEQVPDEDNFGNILSEDLALSDSENDETEEKIHMSKTDESISTSKTDNVSTGDNLKPAPHSNQIRKQCELCDMTFYSDNGTFGKHMTNVHLARYCRTCMEYLPIQEEEEHKRLHAESEYKHKKIRYVNIST